jgi:hypothetical protein
MGSGDIVPPFLPQQYIKESGQLQAPVASAPGEQLLVPTREEAGWAPEPVVTKCRRKQYLDPAQNLNLTPLSSNPWLCHYTDRAIPPRPIYEGESVSRSQMDMKRKTCDIRTWERY